MGLRVASTIALVVFFGVLFARVARADPIDDRTRAAARELAEAAAVLYDKGDYAGALERFEKAEQLVPVPTIAVHVARCLAALGRKVAASEKYVAIAAMPVDPAAPASYQAAQQQAKDDARVELEALKPTLARIEIVIDGGAPEALSLDGAPLPLALAGTPVPVDPGEHRIGARRGTAAPEQTVTVAAGETGRVTLQLPDEEPAAQREPPGQPIAVALPQPAAREGGPSTMTTLGWVGVGLGGASLVAGVVIGALALDRQGDLRDRCPDDVCLESQAGADAEDDIAEYGRLRSASIATLVIGGVLAGAGVTLLLTAPSPESASARVELAPGGATVRGRF